MIFPITLTILMAHNIYVSNVPMCVNTKTILEFFERYGSVKSVLPIDIGKTAASWKIQYADVRDAFDAARDLHMLHGNQLQVTLEPCIGDPVQGFVELDITGTFHLPNGGTIALSPTRIIIPVAIEPSVGQSPVNMGSF